MNEMERTKRYQKMLRTYLQKFLAFLFMSLSLLVIAPIAILDDFGLLNNGFILILITFGGTYIMIDFWYTEYFKPHYDRILNDYINDLEEYYERNGKS